MKQNKNVEIVVQHIPTDYYAKIQTMFAGKQQLDLLYAGTSSAAGWASDGKLENIIEYMEDDPEFKKDSLMPGTIPEYAPGISAGIYLAIEPFAVYYNPNIFRENNMEMPPSDPGSMWKWDKFLEVAKRLTIDKNGNNLLDNPDDFDAQKITTYGFAFYPGNMYHWLSILGQSGVDRIFDESGKYMLDGPKSIDAFTKMNDLINKYKTSPTMAQTATLPVYGTSILGGKIAMAIEGQWINLDMAKTGKEYDIAPLPRLTDEPSRAIVQCSLLSISSGCNNKDAAWDLYKSVLNPSFNINPYKEGLWMPVLKEWYENPDLYAQWAVNNPAHPSGWKGAFVDTILTNPILDPNHYLPTTLADFLKVTQDFDKFWNQPNSNPEAVLKDIKERAEKAVKKDFE